MARVQNIDIFPDDGEKPSTRIESGLFEHDYVRLNFKNVNITLYIRKAELRDWQSQLFDFLRSWDELIDPDIGEPNDDPA